MAAGGMAATDVTQASEQAKSREFLTKHRFKEPEDGCHAINMEKVVQRRAKERAAEAKRVLLKKDTWAREGGCGGGPEEQIKGETISGMDRRRERSACCTPREKD